MTTQFREATLGGERIHELLRIDFLVAQLIPDIRVEVNAFHFDLFLQT
jgi:hypothetical protein